MTDETTPEPDPLPPTQKLPVPDDAPTERIPSASTPPTPRADAAIPPSGDAPLQSGPLPASTGPAPERRGRGPIVILIVLLVLLLIAAGVIIALLLGTRNQPTGSVGAPPVSATPTPTETAVVSSPEPTASDDDNGVVGGQPTPISKPPKPKPKPTPTATTDDSIHFTSFSIPNATCTDQTGSSPVTIQYSSIGATAAYFGISVGNARDAPTDGPLPPNGPYTFDYQCSNESQLWLITIVDASGDAVTKKAVVHSHQQ